MQTVTVKYLGVAIAVTGEIFSHPCDGSEEAYAIHEAARERGAYPYQHLYEGDSIPDILAELREGDGHQ
jgi:phosphoserine phosphatase